MNRHSRAEAVYNGNMSFLKFLSYHNAVPIAISLALLGAGGAFAATDPNAILSTQQQVISVDNTYLVNKDLSTYSPKVEITGVTEDSDNYYVAYTLFTIDLQNYVWQDVSRSDTMEVSKADLGQYRDLGVYVTEKLGDIVAREHDRLVATQTDARSHVSHEVVATQYGGLVGKFLDTHTEELPGYTPVVKAPPPPAQTSQVAAADATSPSPQPPQQSGSQPTQQPTSNATSTATSTSSATSTAPVLQILGDNPAKVALGATYVDLGAIISSPANSNLGIHVIVNGKEVQQVTIDTSVVGTWHITYQVTDQNGNMGTANREVDVYDPNAIITPPAQDTAAASTTAATTTAPTSQDASSTPTTSTETSTSTATASDSGAGTATSTESDSTTSDATSTPPSSDTMTDASSTSTNTSDAPPTTTDVSSTTQSTAAAASTPDISATSTADTSETSASSTVQ